MKRVWEMNRHQFLVTLGKAYWLTSDEQYAERMISILRSWIAAKRRRPDPGRVDYYKLMPITNIVIVIFGAFSLLTILADIINPINIQ